VMANAAAIAADEATRPARRAGGPATFSFRPLISTSPTVTSGQLAAGQPSSRTIYDSL
jgi:hypothetical protein